MSTGESEDSVVGDASVSGRSAADIIARLKHQLQLATDADLAVVLGVSRTTLSNWRVRNSVPLARLQRICRKAGIPIDYLLTGTITYDRNASAIVDTEILGHIFKLMDSYGYIKLPTSDDADYDPAIRAGAEFVRLQSHIRQIMEIMTSKDGLTQENAKRAILHKAG